MSKAIVPVKFVIGSRKLFAVPRSLDTVAFGLEDLVSGNPPPFPQADARSDGLRILSAPVAALDGIRARFPRHIIGGLQSYERFYIEMEGRSYADYLAGFSSKTRSTFNRKRRKLAELSGGALDIREFNRESEVEAFMADSVPLSRRTYQTRLLDAGLPEGKDAIAGMKALARHDLMRAYILYLEGQPISYLYLPTTGGIVTYAYLGYDPNHAHLSVGTVLQMEALERLFAEKRYRYFDFTEGEGAHKQMFGTASVAACSFFLLRPSVTNRLLIGSLNSFNGGVALAKSLAERGGALAHMRRMLRG
jgi:CelD/BcsL family acetyltransferase involved in cellulose biosynthesis